VESTNTTLENKIVRILNPFRYRGYYYDTETGLYYLQSRYYNPAWGRFLNADVYLSTGTGLIGQNMYLYCDNNPVVRFDPGGDIWIEILLALALVGGIGLSLSSCSSVPQTEYIETEETLYATVKDAVFAFGNAYLDISIAQNREYGAFIYEVTRNNQVYFTYSIISVGTVDTTHLKLPITVKDSQVRALVHTHGAEMAYYSNGFSPEDLDNAAKWKDPSGKVEVNSYLFTPGKELFVHNPNNGSIFVVQDWKGAYNEKAGVGYSNRSSFYNHNPYFHYRMCIS
jgi:RHS repeat-associated protein